MDPKVELDAKYAPSDDIVAREIEGELIIVPISSGVGDMEAELFTLNETGKAVWKRLDGTNDLRSVIGSLAGEFEAPRGEIEEGVLGLVGELLKRRMLVDRRKP
jgi:hypothetical protein